MTQYATIADLTAKYNLTPAQTAVADTYLQDASVLIRDILAAEGKSVEEYEDDTIVKICRDVAYRGLSAVQAGSAVSQYTESAIGYAETFTFSNPQGDLYLTKLEKKQLGISGSRMFSIYPHLGVFDNVSR